MLSILFLISSVLSLTPITTNGNAFFQDDTRFYIRGLDYQPGGSSTLTDGLADSDICDRDIPNFVDLGINTIRVYHVDNTLDHDYCMNKLNDAGIYVLIDTNLPKSAISNDETAECTYNSFYLEQVFATVKQFSEYDNTLGFFVANEVINSDNTTSAAPYVKAVVRDTKKYIKNNDIRAVPIGYSAADVSSNRLQTAHYFNCGDDEDARVDMFGFNDYSWCGQSSFTRSGYDQKVEAFNDYSIPIFFSEYGCNEVTPRVFTEVESLYSTDMTPVFSGGLVYEYSQEPNNYGLVEVISDSEVELLTDFDNLKSEFEKTSNPSGDGGYHSDLDYSECPELSDKWEADNVIPDTPSAALKWINGDEEPEALGFDAETQWKCTIEPEEDDDSSNSGSGSGSNGASSSRAGNSANSGSDSDSNSNGESSSGIADSVSGSGLVKIVGLFAGLALL